MKLSLHTYDILRQRINIVDVIKNYVTLKKAGSNYVGLCPAHVEKSPSFTVNHVKNFYHCFGCGVHGDVIKFIALVSNLTYKESAIKLAHDFGIQIVDDHYEDDEITKVSKVLEQALNFFKQSLDAASVQYLNKRSILNFEKFDIGYADDGNKLIKFLTDYASTTLLHKAGLIAKNDYGNFYDVFRNRIMFPIRNVYNTVIGFGGRSIDPKIQPKYLNSPETILFKKSEVLYLENLAINTAIKTKNIILVEGYIDCITLHNHGITNAVATLGTAITESHLLKLWKYIGEIIVCMDGDNAGLNAMRKIIHSSLQHISSTLQISFIIIPNGNDPDEYILAHGIKKFHELIAQRMTSSQAIWYFHTDGKVFNTPESKSQLEQSLQNFCHDITDTNIKKNYIYFFKQECYKLFSPNKYKSYDDNKLAQIISIIKSKSSNDLSLLLTSAPRNNIELNLLCIFTANPELFQDHDLASEFISLEVQNDNLRFMQEYIITKFSSDENIENDCYFLQISAYLLDINNMFADRFDKSLSYFKNKVIVLFKEQKLILLKQELSRLPINEDNYLKLSFYQDQISGLEQEILSLKYNLSEI